MTRISLVLFDLDGTLVDSAPDLAQAVNQCRIDRKMLPLPLAQLRPYASQGARGLIGKAFGLTPEQPEFAPLRDEFLANYESALCVHSRLFDGVEELLRAIEACAARWGIVTNKAQRFSLPLLRALDLDKRAACIVSGDSTAHAKPHPAPLEHALKHCAVSANSAVYIGDDARDIECGRAAEVAATAIAAYGYIAPEEDLARWRADFVAASARDLLAWLRPRGAAI